MFEMDDAGPTRRQTLEGRLVQLSRLDRAYVRASEIELVDGQVHTRVVVPADGRWVPNDHARVELHSGAPPRCMQPHRIPRHVVEDPEVPCVVQEQLRAEGLQWTSHLLVDSLDLRISNTACGLRASSCEVGSAPLSMRSLLAR